MDIKTILVLVAATVVLAVPAREITDGTGPSPRGGPRPASYIQWYYDHGNSITPFLFSNRESTKIPLVFSHPTGYPHHALMIKATDVAGRQVMLGLQAYAFVVIVVVDEPAAGEEGVDNDVDRNAASAEDVVRHCRDVPQEGGILLLQTNAPLPRAP
ncbi:hypothetical protein LZ31DRAFT_546938 [Colletotrichum somersetense]|nr:hypothetical protein LZ31DRAFT_546938 [Colletotrichum somersetense]